MASSKISLGLIPGGLELNLVADDPFAATIELVNSANPTAGWPVAPVLEIRGDETYNRTATLSGTNDEYAHFEYTEAEVNEILALADQTVRLSVGEVTWVSGVVIQRG